MTTRNKFVQRFAVLTTALILTAIVVAMIAGIAWLWSFDTGKIVIFAVAALVALLLAHRSKP